MPSPLSRVVSSATAAPLARALERGSTRTCSVASTVSALRCGEGCSALQRLSMSGQDAQQAGWEWTNT